MENVSSYRGTYIGFYNCPVATNDCYYMQDTEGTKDVKEQSGSIKVDEEMEIYGPIQETDDINIG